MTEFEKAREEINRIDKQLARLFEERMAAVKTVAEYKKQNGVRVTDLSREAEVIKRNSSLIENEALKPYFVSFLQSNMDISKAYQHRLLEGMRVASAGLRARLQILPQTAFSPTARRFPAGILRRRMNLWKRAKTIALFCRLKTATTATWVRLWTLPFSAHYILTEFTILR